MAIIEQLLGKSGISKLAGMVANSTMHNQESDIPSQGNSSTIHIPNYAIPVTMSAVAASGMWSTVLVITPTTGEAELLTQDCSCYLGRDSVRYLPPWDTLPFERVSPHTEIMGKRLEVIWKIIDQESRSHLSLVISPIRAALQRLGDLQAARPLSISTGQVVDLQEVATKLSFMGYRREYIVEHKGEYAIRGGILDIYPSTSDMPVRVDLFGDNVDRISHFDPGDQLSRDRMRKVTVYAARELLPTEQIRSKAATLAQKATSGQSQFDKISQGMLFDGMESWFTWLCEEERLITDLFEERSLIIITDPQGTANKAKEIIEDELAIAEALSPTWNGELSGKSGMKEESPRLHLPHDRLLSNTPADLLQLTTMTAGPEEVELIARPVELPVSEPEALTRSLEDMAKNRYRVFICAHGSQSVTTLKSRFDEYGIGKFKPSVLPGEYPDKDPDKDPGEASDEDSDEDSEPSNENPAVLPDSGPVDGSGSDSGSGLVDGSGSSGPVNDNGLPQGIYISITPISQGVILPESHVAIITEADLSGHRHRNRQLRRSVKYRPRDEGGTFFDELSVGSYVVHRDHGVARYTGLVTREMGGKSGDYLLLEYKGNDKLYIPVDQIELLTPYTGGDAPTLNRLGGSDWERTRSRAKTAIKRIAEDLVELYKERLMVEGYQFSPDTPWQQEFEDAFPYTETTDQLRAIEEVKADMEQPRPMDRLICGDVGFGKTEVALRAVFKAIQDGKQAAVLVPTTLLGQQHTQNFKERLAPFPVRVESLSRFTTDREARLILAGLQSGEIDVVIGTHRLLQENTVFHNLGLVVIDEEQRFGVSHKETLKSIAKGVDMITLTANPIPRTLEMALTGIREMSLIRTPPAERQPILTYVGEYDEAAVVEAIRRELLREGLVFYVHNHVHDINTVAAKLQSLVPETRIAVAHGQMDDTTLEKVMIDVWEHRYDVLVATTIIESGIDVPEASTLVVDRADRLGLGQLHQLRGRVGRAGQRAYAYFLYPREKNLTETAYERLRTIGENTELGSGIKIAMRDLEIRGAGNLLGHDQSGHISAVGYDLYVQMVAEAVSQAKGEPQKIIPKTSIEMPIKASIPAEYISKEDIRLEAYRKLANATSYEAVGGIRGSWIDRFGPIPQTAETLIDTALLRVTCLNRGITNITASNASPEQVRMARTRLASSRLASRSSRHSTSRRTNREDISAGAEKIYAVNISPIGLRASSEVRLARLYPSAVYKDKSHEISLLIDSNPHKLPSTIDQLITDLLP